MADVFVVEDVSLQQTIIGSFLQPEHTVVGTATDGKEAIERIKAQKPDVAIMDINLPSVDGLTAAEEIKSHSPETRIIISTALVNDEIKQLANEIPIEGYLIKPYSAPELLEAIEDAIE